MRNLFEDLITGTARGWIAAMWATVAALEAMRSEEMLAHDLCAGTAYDDERNRVDVISDLRQPDRTMLRTSFIQQHEINHAPS